MVVTLFFCHLSGWVTENAISAFNGDTFQSKFDKKKFKGDKNYRAGVLEAVIITKARGVKYPSETNELIAESSAVKRFSNFVMT
jgi:hypothetical protein